MTDLTTRDLCTVANADHFAGPDRPIGPVSIDSRTTPAGATFFCLTGPKFDGHDYAASAVERGAAVVVARRASVHKLPPAIRDGRVTLLTVADPEKALTALASEARLRFAGTVVGVTGSCGKTTTKEMIAAVLSAGGATHKTTGNLNNHLGVPLTLLAMRGDERFAVIEMGMNHLGEIAHLCGIARPLVGAITVVGAAHLAGVGGLAGVAAAKGELFTALPADGVAVMPSDIRFPWVVTRHLLAPVVLVGDRPGDEVRLVRAEEAADGARGLIEVDGERHALRLHLAGEHNLRNALIAIAIGRALDVPPARAIEALAEVRPPSMRGEVRLLADGGRVLLDCYNANPTSMAAALASFARTAPPGGVLVLGDMMELGDEAPQAHAALAKEVLAVPEATLIGVGPLSVRLVEASRAAGLPPDRALHVADAVAASRALRERRAAGSWVLVKGSRAMGLERVWPALSVGGEG
jgi:UDP-N-acetylmuramoyl-tripeptide--D-alanyl-D-alanine ligase